MFKITVGRPGDNPNNVNTWLRFYTHEDDIATTNYARILKVLTWKCLAYYPEDRVTAQELVEITGKVVAADDAGTERLLMATKFDFCKALKRISPYNEYWDTPGDRYWFEKEDTWPERKRTATDNVASKPLKEVDLLGITSGPTQNGQPVPPSSRQRSESWVTLDGARPNDPAAANILAGLKMGQV